MSKESYEFLGTVFVCLLVSAAVFGIFYTKRVAYVECGQECGGLSKVKDSGPNSCECK